MREIKFRAWDGKRYTIDFFITSEGTVFKPHYDRNAEIVSDFTIEQFTGLHDKNGKEIYEGDIDEARGICVWIEEDCRWAFQEVETGHQHGLFAITGDFNIIGNIHENPELLEVAK